jgi:hypothetical protein
MPHTCHSQEPSGLAQLGGKATFANPVTKGLYAPISPFAEVRTRGGFHECRTLRLDKHIFAKFTVANKVSTATRTIEFHCHVALLRLVPRSR